MIRRGITTAVLAGALVAPAGAYGQDDAEIPSPPPAICMGDIPEAEYIALRCDWYQWPEDSESEASTEAPEADSGPDEGSGQGSNPPGLRTPNRVLPVVTVLPGTRVRVVGGHRERGRVCVVVERVMRGTRRDRDWLRCRVRPGKTIRVQRFNVKAAQ